MQKYILYIVSIILFASNYVAGDAEDMDISKPEITLSKTVPVVDNELEIKLETNSLIKDDVIFSIIYEGKKILEEKINPANSGKFLKKWIPKETGFYTASFDFGNKGNISKVSLDFPVVWRELYFTIWPPLSKEESRYRYLSSYVILHGEKGSGHGEEMIAFWKSRGAKTLNCTDGMQVIDMEISEEEAIKKAVAHWSTPMKKGFDGIFMDEFGEYPLPELLKKVDRAGKALMQLRKENPDMLIFPAAGGAQLREETISYKYSDSIALIETYDHSFEEAFGTHSFKQHLDYRVMVARNTDLIYERGRKHGAIILLGMGVDGGGMLISQLEDMVRYTKKIAPEMPGIAFYSGDREKQWTVDSGLRQAAEDFCLKYYIKPVIDVREMWFSNYSPSTSDKVDIFVRVHNLGGIDAKNIKIRIYAIEDGKGKKEQIGKEIIIKKIGTGVVNFKMDTTDKPRTYYEYKDIDGNTYPIFTTKPQSDYDRNIIMLDRHVVKASWEPKKQGYYTIIAEVEPSSDYTILDGILRKEICIK